MTHLVRIFVAICLAGALDISGIGRLFNFCSVFNRSTHVVASNTQQLARQINFTFPFKVNPRACRKDSAIRLLIHFRPGPFGAQDDG